MEILQAWVQKSGVLVFIYKPIAWVLEKWWGVKKKEQKKKSGRTVNFCIFFMAVKCYCILEKIGQELYKYELATKPPLHP